MEGNAFGCRVAEIQGDVKAGASLHLRDSTAVGTKGRSKKAGTNRKLDFSLILA